MPRRFLFITCLILGSTLGAGAIDAEIPRVRVIDASINPLLVTGYTTSPTFKALIDRLERSDVIVHIEPRPLRYRHHRIGGVIKFVTLAGGFRYLRISVGVQFPRDTAVALIGHELQHALEVAGDASVVDAHTFERLYRRIGDTCLEMGAARAYDTPGARSVERRIRGELRDSSSRDVFVRR